MKVEKLSFIFFCDIFSLQLMERENRIWRRQSNVNLSHIPHHRAGNHEPRAPCWYLVPWNSCPDGLKPTSGLYKGPATALAQLDPGVATGQQFVESVGEHGQCGDRIHICAHWPSSCGRGPEMRRKWCVIVQASSPGTLNLKLAFQVLIRLYLSR